MKITYDVMPNTIGLGIVIDYGYRAIIILCVFITIELSID